MLGRMLERLTPLGTAGGCGVAKLCEGSTKLKPSIPGYRSRASERTPRGAAHWVQTRRHPQRQSSITAKAKRPWRNKLSSKAWPIQTTNCRQP